MEYTTKCPQCGATYSKQMVHACLSGDTTCRCGALVRAGEYHRCPLERHGRPIPAPELVNHPDHYGGDTTYEVIKVLRAWGLLDDALLFNVIKYVARARKKGNERRDLEKAEWYLQEKLQELGRPRPEK